MKISIGSDHAGYKLKNIIVQWLISDDYEVLDKGTFSDKSVDYPDFAVVVASDVLKGIAEKGILICGSGIGIAMAANKIKGIRAANCYNEEIARLSRAHNDANVLTLGARFVDPEMAINIIKAWLETKFEGGRHQRRIEKISQLEERG